MLSTSIAPISLDRQLVPAGPVRTLFRPPARRRARPLAIAARISLSATTAHRVLATQMANLPAARRPPPARWPLGLAAAAMLVAAAALVVLGGAL